MERLLEIRSRRKSLGELLDVVSAMRSLAAARVQQARNALPAIRSYTDIIDGALAQAIALTGEAPEPRVGNGTGRSAVVLFASEHGFVGAFNERALEKARTMLATAQGDLLVVGSRGAALAQEQGIPNVWESRMAAHGDGVAEVARTVASEVLARVAMSNVQTVHVVYTKSAAGVATEVVRRSLLPFDPAPYKDRAPAKEELPPMLNQTPGELLDELIEEQIIAELMRAAMESFVSENAARLETMESTRSNIESKLEELTASERRLRQDEITTELLDVVTGAQAVVRSSKGQPGLNRG